MLTAYELESKGRHCDYVGLEIAVISAHALGYGSTESVFITCAAMADSVAQTLKQTDGVLME